MQAPSKFKQRNSHFVWCSNKEIEGFIDFMKSKGFLWEESENIFYNKDKDITFNCKDLVEVVKKFSLLDKKVQLIEEKRISKDNYCVDDFRVAGYLINIFLSLSIVNVFLGWIFFNIVFWVILQLILVILTVSFSKIRKKIFNTLKQKC